MSGGSADLGRAAPDGTSPGPGAQLGGFTLEQPLWKLSAADVYRASAQGHAATLLIVRPEIAGLPAARDAILAAAKRAAQVPENKHLVRTLGAGVDQGFLWIATEEIDGSLVRDLLARKRDAGGGGFGARGAGNLVIGVAGALAAAGQPHGGLGVESVIVNRTGRVRVLDLPLGPGLAAAIAARRVAAASHTAPEIATGAPTEASDVYALGALLYEVLVGRPLQKGGPRPSEVVPGLTAQIDELVARMCARNPDKRFGSVEVVKELIAEALGRGGAVEEAAPASQSQPSFAAASTPSLATALSSPGISLPAASDPALAAALADTNEKWLIAKGRLDYGPFSLADVVAQIKAHQIVAGNVVIDKDSGGRFKVEEHPILGPMVEEAKQAKDHARRAEAEESHQTREKTRGVVLYGVIAAGVIGLAIGVFFLVKALGSDEGKQAKGIDNNDGVAKLDVKISMPKEPPKVAHHGGGHRGGGGHGGGGNGTDALAFDMSGDDDDDSGAPLDMQTVYNVYSKHGGGFVKCLGGGGSANIAIIIDGKSGRVTFVKVDGGQSGSTYSCINSLMRSMQFPTTTAPRTRAEFDISL